MLLRYLWASLALCLSLTLVAENSKQDEQKIKANFIYALGQYVTWPIGDELAEFNFCVAGNLSKIIEELNFIVKRRGKYKGRQTNLIIGNDSFSQCHLLFIPNSETDDYLKINNQFASLSTLVISEAEKGLPSGVHINLIKVDNKIGFEVDIQQLELNNLSASSKVLRLAKRIIR